MHEQAFYDATTGTLTYVAFHPHTRDAVVIDPVLDYDAAASRTFTHSADIVRDFVREQSLRVHYVLETHAHADHLSGAYALKQHWPEAHVTIGHNIAAVQRLFKELFELPSVFPTDGSQFDRLVSDGDVLDAGSIRIEVLETPGHTPACVSYKIDDALFVGDALFMPDTGTGRCDFPGGSARDLYRSIMGRIYTQAPQTRTLVGHDYRPGRDWRYCATVAEQRERNVAVRHSTTEEQFVSYREGRDRSLDTPKLFYQSLQVNIDAGRLPAPQGNRIRYFKIPVNAFLPKQISDAPTFTPVRAPAWRS